MPCFCVYLIAAVAISARSARSSETFAPAVRADYCYSGKKIHAETRYVKFKLYYSSKFRVLRSTKISNTFLCNSKPRDVIKLGFDQISIVFFCVPKFGHT